VGDPSRYVTTHPNC